MCETGHMSGLRLMIRRWWHRKMNEPVAKLFSIHSGRLLALYVLVTSTYLTEAITTRTWLVLGVLFFPFASLCYAWLFHVRGAEWAAFDVLALMMVYIADSSRLPIPQGDIWDTVNGIRRVFPRRPANKG